MVKQDPVRLAKASLETADGLRWTGTMDGKAHAQVTLRRLGKPTGAAGPISAQEMRQVRERAHLSQAMFACCLDVTSGDVSHLERGAKRPTGAAVALLNVMRRKGIEVVL